MSKTYTGTAATKRFVEEAARCETKEDMIDFCEEFLSKNKPPSEEAVQNEINRYRVGEESFLQQDVYGKGTRLTAYHKIDEMLLNSYNATDKYHFEDDVKRELIRILTQEAHRQGMITFSSVRSPMDLSVRYGAEMFVIPPRQKIT